MSETPLQVAIAPKGFDRSPAGEEILEAGVISGFLAAAVFLCQWRYGFNLGDEGWLWYVSQRTAQGELPVRDWFSYDPGRYYWSAAVFQTLGKNGFFEQLAANYLFGAVGLFLVAWAMAYGGLSRPRRIMILVLLAVILGFPRHKIYEQSLSLVSAAGMTFVLAESRRPKRWFLYGVATGLAACVGRNSGAYFAVAAILAFVLLKVAGARLRTLPSAGVFLAGVAVGYLPVLYLMGTHRGFGSALIDSLLLSPRWSWSLPIPFPWHSHAGGLHGIDRWQMRAVSWLCLVVPVSYALLAWRGARKRRSGPAIAATGASLAGIPYLHHAFYHADFFHIAQGVVPFVVALGAFADELSETGRRRAAVLTSVGLVALILACWLPREPLIAHLRARRDGARTEQIQLGHRAFEVPLAEAEIMRASASLVEQCGRHDGALLAAPYYPGLYAYLGIRAPFWDTYYLWPRSQEVQAQHIQALIAQRTSVVLLNREASLDGRDWLRIGRTYPKLVDYVLTHYQPSGVELPQAFELYTAPTECRPAG